MEKKMVKFPSWLDGERSKTSYQKTHIKKCPKCGQEPLRLAIDEKGNYRCSFCGKKIDIE